MAIIMNHRTYEEFILKDEYGHSLWTIPGPLSRDLVAGLASGLRVMLDDIQRKIAREINYTIYLRIMGEARHLAFNIMNSYIPAMEPYFPRAEGYLSKEMIDLTKNYPFNPRNEWFGWWIRAPGDLRYVTYSFPTPDFIQGFISMCNAFGADFRDYIYGLPFKYDPQTREMTYYEIRGYAIEPIPPF